MIRNIFPDIYNSRYVYLLSTSVAWHAISTQFLSPLLPSSTTSVCNKQAHAARHIKHHLQGEKERKKGRETQRFILWIFTSFYLVFFGIHAFNIVIWSIWHFDTSPVSSGPGNLWIPLSVSGCAWTGPIMVSGLEYRQSAFENVYEMYNEGACPFYLLVHLSSQDIFKWALSNNDYWPFPRVCYILCLISWTCYIISS